MGFSGSSDCKESACNSRDLSSNPGSGRSPGEGMAIHSSILAWEIPWCEAGYRLCDLKELDMTLTTAFTFTFMYL